MKWIKVSERLPEYNTPVLVKSNSISGTWLAELKKGEKIQDYWQPITDCSCCNCTYYLEIYDEWMPLPEPPKD